MTAADLDRIPPKPREGEACNGCGPCCAVELCSLAIDIVGATEPPCPVLEFADGRFWCGAARSPSRYFDLPAFSDRFMRPLVHRALSIGEGCDAAD